MSNDDCLFWTLLCSIAAVGMLALICITEIQISYNHAIVEMVNKGVDPISAGCAVGSIKESSGICQIRAAQH